LPIKTQREQEIKAQIDAVPMGSTRITGLEALKNNVETKIDTLITERSAIYKDAKLAKVAQKLSDGHFQTDTILDVELLQTSLIESQNRIDAEFYVLEILAQKTADAYLADIVGKAEAIGDDSTKHKQILEGGTELVKRIWGRSDENFKIFKSRRQEAEAQKKILDTCESTVSQLIETYQDHAQWIGRLTETSVSDTAAAMLMILEPTLEEIKTEISQAHMQFRNAVDKVVREERSADGFKAQTQFNSKLVDRLSGRLSHYKPKKNAGVEEVERTSTGNVAESPYEMAIKGDEKYYTFQGETCYTMENMLKIADYLNKQIAAIPPDVRARKLIEPILIRMNTVAGDLQQIFQVELQKSNGIVPYSIHPVCQGESRKVLEKALGVEDIQSWMADKVPTNPMRGVFSRQTAVAAVVTTPPLVVIPSPPQPPLPVAINSVPEEHAAPYLTEELLATIDYDDNSDNMSEASYAPSESSIATTMLSPTEQAIITALRHLQGESENRLSDLTEDSSLELENYARALQDVQQRVAEIEATANAAAMRKIQEAETQAAALLLSARHQVGQQAAKPLTAAEIKARKRGHIP